MSNPQEPPAETRPKRRFINRAEWLTMLGMVGLVGSLFMAWRNASLNAINLPIPAEAIYKAKHITQNGFSLLGWEIMVACAIVCNACILISPTSGNRKPLSLVQGVAGLGATLIALRYFSPHPGAILGLVACLALAWGAYERFRDASAL